MINNYPPSKDKIARLESILGEELSKKVREKANGLAINLYSDESMYPVGKIRDIDPLELVNDFFESYESKRVVNFISKLMNEKDLSRKNILSYLAFYGGLSEENSINLVEKIGIPESKFLFQIVLNEKLFGLNSHYDSPNANQLIAYSGGVDRFSQLGKAIAKEFRLNARDGYYQSGIFWIERFKDLDGDAEKLEGIQYVEKYVKDRKR